MIWNAIAILLSVASLSVSAYTLWLAQLRRGQLQMTHPTLICMLREGAKPKIFLRTLLFCTAERGCVVEGMYVKLHNDGGTYLFDAWGYGETNKLVVGGGLFVPRSGVAFNHHFVLHRSEMEFAFFGGDYRIEVFAKVLGRSEAIMLKEMDVVLEGNQGPTMAQVFDATAFFEWDIEAKRYISSVERRPAPFGPTKSE